MSKNTKKILIICSAIFFVASLSKTASAAFQINIPIPGLGEPTLTNYAKALYRFAIGALAILSMGIIMIGGYEYMISAGESITKTSSAKARIKNAIIGLIVALISFLVLNTINPDILKAPAELIKTNVVADPNKLAKEGELCGTQNGQTYPNCEAPLECKEVVGTTLMICQGTGTGGTNNLNFASASVANQYASDASEPLKIFLQCMADLLPSNMGIISSISDDNITNGTCTIWSTGVCNKPECQHNCTSCHYGGGTGKKESYAVDYDDEQNEIPLKEASEMCNADFFLPENGNHIHISVGQSNGASCN